MLITDAQVHLWEPDRPDRPWPDGSEVLAQHAGHGNRFSAEELSDAMARAGVDRAVIVPPSWAGYEGANLTALEAAERYPGRFAVMGLFEPNTQDARDRLERWLSRPHMLGIRLSFLRPPATAWLDEGAFDWVWPAAERLRIPLMVNLPGRVPLLAQLAERHPGLTLIVDHLGARTLPTGFADLGDLEGVLALARFPNVYVKATSVPALSKENYPYRDIHGILRRAYDAFGPRRLCWGSDYTRLRGTYRECLALFQEALDFLSAEDREWILGRALAQAIRWPEQANV